MTAGTLHAAPLPRVQRADITSPCARNALTSYLAETDAPLRTGTLDGSQHVAFVLAVHDGHAVACGALERDDHGTVVIRHLWVRRTWRGRGLARRVVDALHDIAAHEAPDAAQPAGAVLAS